MNDPSCLLALDLGTTTGRCLAFDAEGHVLAEASREVTVYCPAPGYAEVDPGEWWVIAQEVIRCVLASTPSLSTRLLAMGMTGLQHAMVAIDDQGQVMGRTMLWMDQRCRPQIERLNTTEKETLESVLGRGARVTATPSLAKLAWLADNQPELVRKARYFLPAKDYIRYRLTGSIATDPSDAGGTMLYDRHSGDWSPGLVRLAGIVMHQLPPIRPSQEVAGTITREAARLTGLSEGLPIVVGGGDVRATVLGLGGDASHQAMIYMGTAAWMRLPSGGSSGWGGATATTGAALRWLRDLVGSSYKELMAEAAQVPAGAEGLIFLPHLCGERGPFFSPEARGSLLGLSLIHKRGHLAKAILEGCVCHLRWMMEGADKTAFKRAVVAGGAAKSAHWMQILADVLGLEVWLPEVVEAGALGAAILAAIGGGLYQDEQEAIEHMVRLSRHHVPREELRPLYDGLYERFLQAERMTMAARGEVFPDQAKGG